MYLNLSFFTLFNSNMTSVKISFACWIFIVIACFVYFELKWNYNLSFKRLNCKVEDEKKSMIHPHISVEDYDKLSKFTWKEFNERVRTGANLVVCDGLVVDVHKWIHTHPGGGHIITRVIGSDITNDFYNKHQNVSINEEFDAPAAPLSSTEEPSKKNSMISKYIYHLQGKYTSQKKTTFATMIDFLNSKYYLKVPIAQHTHSKLATKKMASMVIGKIERVEKDYISERRSLDSQINSLSKDGNELLSNIDHIKFHRYKLTSKEMVNVNDKIPVMRFTFTKIYQCKNDYSEKFYPGNYIELFAKIKGQMIIRQYCPLEGKISKSLSIYVKIYPNGLLSQHLNKQLLGYEILIRGPFNFKLSPYKYIGFSPFPIKGSLLNPNCLDGCWNELYMIAGGAGVIPMLQLIKYHLEQSAKQNNGVDNYKRMNLLYANDTIKDIIDGILLEDLALTSRGQLTVTYCLSNPPEEWKGLIGILNLNLLSEWLSKMGCESSSYSEQHQSSSNNGNIFLSNSVRNVGYNGVYNIEDDQKNSKRSFVSSLSQINKTFHTIQPSMRSSKTSLQLDREISDDFNNKFTLQNEVSKETFQSSINLNTFPSALRTGDLQASTSPAITTPREGTINNENEIESTLREISLSEEISSLFDQTSRNNLSHRKIIVGGPNVMIKVVEHALYNLGYNEHDMILLYS
ncbi:heme peroxidase [Gigaspora margarita]|uniref:Heme peroxidase n=1 Tax=Gigaspora margarita TaxID=4874 RepID=A0A8H4B2L4_GIGMA|nr:heme peroxidase [Gigaspora margarita]